MAASVRIGTGNLNKLRAPKTKSARRHAMAIPSTPFGQASRRYASYAGSIVVYTLPPPVLLCLLIAKVSLCRYRILIRVDCKPDCRTPPALCYCNKFRWYDPMTA